MKKSTTLGAALTAALMGTMPMAAADQAEEARTGSRIKTLPKIVLHDTVAEKTPTVKGDEDLDPALAAILAEAEAAEMED